MNEILSKLFSGRYYLTLCAGFAFVYLSCKGILQAETASLIIVMVMKDYFTKKENV